MPPPSTKTLSPAELAKLEHAFATEPGSEAYKPLAEAYLGMGRYMEAMVVCKKGVKAHPTRSDPRILLARVYAEQGKDRKALEELASALQVVPADKVALRMTGSLQMKVGEADAGKQSLLKALAADPNDAETQAVLAQWKIEVPRAAPPPPPVAQQPMQPVQPGPVPVQPRSMPAGTQPGVAARPAVQQGQPPMLQQVSDSNVPIVVGEPLRAPARGPGNGAVQRMPAAQQRATSSRGAARRTVSTEDMVSEVSDISDGAYRRRGGKGLGVTLGLVVVLVLGGGGYMGYGRWKALNQRKINKFLRDSADLLRHDSFDSYKRACDTADQALEVDPSNADAHAYLAYAYAIRWGEHGGGDEARKRTEEHLEMSRKGGKETSYLFSAEALYKMYSGKGAEAISELETRVRTFEKENRKSALMYLTLGMLQQSVGDLEHARDSFESAQAMQPDDARIFSAMGSNLRRRGLDVEALVKFDYALRYEKDHHDSLIGKALVVLDQDSPDRGYIAAAKAIKKVLDSEPPPSPRQLALAHFARALLVSRVNKDLPLYNQEAFRKELQDGTGVGPEKDKNATEVKREEDQGFSLDRGNPELYLIRGKRLMFEDNIEGAVGSFNEAIRMDGSRAHYHLELARALMVKPGREREAEDVLRKALGLLPGSPKLLTMLGHVYRRQGKQEEAISQYEQAVRDTKAKNPEARWALGLMYRDGRKDYDKAIASFDKSAIEYVGQSYFQARSYCDEAVAYETKGDKAKARDLYERALRADKDYEGCYWRFAKYLLTDAKDRDKAKDFAKEYLRLTNNQGEFAADMQKIVTGG